MNFIFTILLLTISFNIILGKNNQIENKINVNLESIETRVKKSIYSNVPYKWSFPIDYKIDTGVNETTVKKALEILEKETCIRFRKTNTFTNGGLLYKLSTGCRSYVGKISNSKPQEVYLGDTCDYFTAAIHETSHALGVDHEMCRHDRNNYLTILFQNIHPQVASNFIMQPPSNSLTYNTKYDYGSVMHYDRFAGSFNNQPAMLPRYSSYTKTFGQRSEYGFNDAKRLNMHYCNHICPKKLKCVNGGYTDPNNCKICKCPRFFTGVLCLKVKESDKSCGNVKYLATDKDKFIEAKGKKSCYFQIKAPPGFRIKLSIVNLLSIPDQFVCQPGSGLEIKYLADKTVSGALFCGRDMIKELNSEHNTVIMRYVGKTPFDKIKIKYRRIK
ncbi:Astacin-like metalloendopeptidase [Strongyloides ratti]|uniref:Zinc metalloproteinase n=1 Tax=Strongyloides ratti TaxID=34506 RepID=A0A090LNX8_STRRB|nr:Astacin-like metalloendopeptidase [Strongyloides ratti]CEF69894.1 Astacin-like metalloendopeptidase [Strongyloides ratti]